MPSGAARRPVVHIREERINRGDGRGAVLLLVQYQRVEVVLVQIPVRQVGQKFPDIRHTAQLLCQSAAVGHTDAENALRRERRHEPRHERGVRFVAQREKPAAYRFRRAAHALMRSARHTSPVSTSFHVNTPFSKSR